MEGNDKKDELMDNIRNLIRRRRRKGESIYFKMNLTVLAPSRLCNVSIANRYDPARRALFYEVNSRLSMLGELTGLFWWNFAVIF
jgi:hypothetical protein